MKVIAKITDDKDKIIVKTLLVFEKYSSNLTPAKEPMPIIANICIAILEYFA